MKLCKQCNVLKDESEFPKNKNTKDGLYYLCKLCKNAYSKLHYDKDNHRQYNRRYKQSERGKEVLKAKYLRMKSDEDQMKRIRAHTTISHAIRDGKLVKPNSCSNCGNTKSRIEGHHNDYDKLLDVIWLCHECHMEVHYQ